MLAVGETWDNGKPVRETMAADLPLAVDHFRYFAGAIRAQEGHLSQIDDDTVAYHFHEPLGVVGQIIPWNFPMLMATWKLAPALAAGNAVVLKPAEQTPASIMLLMELIADLLPAGRGQRRQRLRRRGRRTARLVQPHPQDRLHRRDHDRPADHAERQPEPDPGHPRARRQEPEHLLRGRRATKDDAFYDKALEGFAMFALNQGEVCTCPSRALIQNSILEQFLPAATERTKQIMQGNPLDTDTMIGAQASNDQLEKILSYFEIGVQEGARIITGGERVDLGGDLSGGYYVAPTIFQGHNKMRVFQEEIFGPVVSVTGFDDYDDAIEHRQRHALRPRRRRVVARHQHGLPRRPRHPGRPGVDELLPPVPGARGVRWLQVLGHRPREPHDDARPLPADQEPAGVATPRTLGFF